MYVQTVLDVHKKYNALVMSAFNNDAGFVAALDKACGRFITAGGTAEGRFSASAPRLSSTGFYRPSLRDEAIRPNA